ncbi:1351_t:CDS:2, partial [Entrophospora sp. SA101]
ESIFHALFTKDFIMSTTNLKNLAYNILKEFVDPIVNGKEFPELEKCSECNNKIFSHPLKAFTTLQCGHVFHRVCIEKNLLITIPNKCPFPGCNQSVEIVVDISRRESQSSDTSSVIGRMNKQLEIRSTEASQEDQEMDLDDEGEDNQIATTTSKKRPQLIKELSTEPEVPQASVSRKENADNFFDLYNNITNAEAQNEITNQEVIICYYLFGKSFSERLEHHKKSNSPYASSLLVNNEVRNQLPNITDTTLWKKVERSRKIYKLFINIGEDKIRR